jgi:glycosyltransferase involved in cell wall biosynthesis
MYANQPPWHGAAQKVVLFVGRLAPQKNLEAWLQIAKRVHELEPAARFKLVGEGALRAELEAKAASLGIAEVTVFRGAIPYAELPRVYSEARCFLLTSHYEGFGRVVVEACWAGVPVVSTDIVGPREIIQDQVTGFLCPPGDIEQIASRIVALLRDPTLAEAIGVAARENVRQRFDPGVLAQRWMQLLVSAAKGEA